MCSTHGGVSMRQWHSVQRLANCSYTRSVCSHIRSVQLAAIVPLMHRVIDTPLCQSLIPGTWTRERYWHTARYKVFRCVHGPNLPRKERRGGAHGPSFIWFRLSLVGVRNLRLAPSLPLSPPLCIGWVLSLAATMASCSSLWRDQQCQTR